MRYELTLQPFTIHSWSEYIETAAERGTQIRHQHPPPASLSIVCDFPAERGHARFVCGVLIFRVEDAGCIWLEHLVTSRTLPPRLRHHGVKLLVKAVKAYAAATRSTIVLTTSVRGIMRILAKQGFSVKPTHILHCQPTMALGSYEELESKPDPGTIPESGRPNTAADTALDGTSNLAQPKAPSKSRKRAKK